MARLRTGVDELMKLVEEKKKLSVPEAGKILKVPEKTIQAWVDFLVEEHILGIEYKFTTPYIYVHNEEKLRAITEQHEEYILEDFRRTFEHKAAEQGMPTDKLQQLWKEHLKYVIQGQKGFFEEACKRRGVTAGNKLFEQYEEDMIHGSRGMD